MTEKLRVNIPILLPDVPDAADGCVARLISQMQGREGIDEIHLTTGRSGEPAQLCIHYDAEVLPLPRIREIMATAGASITERFGHALWQIEGAVHQRRARTVADRLRALPGVLEAEVNAAGLVRVEFDREQGSEQSIRNELAKMGIRARDAVAAARRGARDDHAGHEHDSKDHDHAKGESGEHTHAHGGLLGRNTELIFSLACGALLVFGYAIEKLVSGASGWLPATCYVAAYFFGGFYTLREAMDNLRLKKFEIDTLMLVAAAARLRLAHGRKVRSCSFFSASATRLNITRWGAPGKRLRAR